MRMASSDRAGGLRLRLIRTKGYSLCAEIYPHFGTGVLAGDRKARLAVAVSGEISDMRILARAIVAVAFRAECAACFRQEHLTTR
jgi:hypothetical protein